MFAVVAGSAALYSFLEIGKVLRQISQSEAPRAIVSLEISRQAERMVNAAPAMLTATTTAQLEQIHSSIAAEGKRIDQRILRLKSDNSGNQALETMDWTLKQLYTNVEKLNDLVVHRFQVSHSRKELLNDFRDAYSKILRLLSASITDLDSKLAQTRAATTAADQGSGQNPKLIGLLESRNSLQAANEHVSTIYGIFLEAQTVERPEQLSALSIRGQKALGALDALTDAFDPALANSLKAQINELHESIEGTGGIFARLEDESAATAKARDILIENAWLSEELSGNVDELVSGAKTRITDSISRANSAQQVSTWVILIIVVLSVTCSTLIVWLYVGRNLIARLTELSVCMESVAGGDLKVNLPSSDVDDEIGRMTRALTVFRDTAVEIEESNLREIGQARQRLMDAIESISEGFCYFDSSDRLVVANNRFRALMYPGAENAIVEGLAFEAMIRNAAHSGYVRIPDNRIDDWVAKRLAQHQHPGAPHLQERANGRWVMVSERRTGDGGTVAIYSDITELKQRETELAEKSKSMEELSNQIAKYLSPQVYESIFTGKQEVKVASHRRKLSIFFSDTEIVHLLLGYRRFHRDG
jgi:PAS domain-containing protein